MRAAHVFAGADAGVKIAACISDLPASGGTCDARGIEGAQTISRTINISKPVRLLLGEAAFNYVGTGQIFKITSNGVSLVGAGRGWRLGAGTFAGRTIFEVPRGSAAKHVVAVDVNSLTIREISFIGAGISDTGKGGGISLLRSVNPVIENVLVENVLITRVSNDGATGACFYGDGIIMSTFRNLTVEDCGGHGFWAEGGTSLLLDTVFAFNTMKSGIFLSNTLYSTIISSASESNGLGYFLNGAKNITIISSAVEGQVNRGASFPGHGFRISGGEAIAIINPLSLNLPQVTNRHFMIDTHATNVTIEQPRVIQGPVTPTYDIEIASGASNVRLITNIATSRISDSGTNTVVSWGGRVAGNYVFRSGTVFDGTLDHAITAVRTWTLPDASGNIPALPTAATTETGTGAIVRQNSPTIHDILTVGGTSRINVVDFNSMINGVQVRSGAEAFAVSQGAIGTQSNHPFDLYANNSRVARAEITGDFRVTAGNLQWQSDTSFVGTLGHSITANRTWNFPDASDTLVGRTTTDTFTNKTLNAEGTGNIILIPEKRWLSGAACNNSAASSQFNIPTSNGSKASCYGTSPQRFGALDFADGGSPLTSTTHITLPADWTSAGGVDIKFIWFSGSTSSSSVVWTVATACIADGEDLLTPTFSATQTVARANNATANTRNSASIKGITTTGCAPGMTLFLRIGRDPTNCSDRLPATAALLGMEVTYRRAM